jgi:hypothetical protein
MRLGVPESLAVLLQELLIDGIERGIRQFPALVTPVPSVKQEFLALSKRKSAVLVTDPEKDLVLGGCMDSIARLDLKSQEMVVAPVVPNARDQSGSSPHRRLTEVDVRLHQCIAVILIPISSLHTPTVDSHYQGSAVCIAKPNLKLGQLARLYPEGLAVVPLILGDRGKCEAAILSSEPERPLDFKRG